MLRRSGGSGMSPAPAMRPLAQESAGEWTSTACESPVLGKPPRPRRPSSQGASGYPDGQSCSPPSTSGGHAISPQVARSSSPAQGSPYPASPPRMLTQQRPPAAPQGSLGLHPKSPPKGKPPRPSSDLSSTWASPGSASKRRVDSPLRLAPLGLDAPVLPVWGERDLRMPSPLARAVQQQPAGMLGLLRNIRRSTPSPIRNARHLDVQLSNSLTRLPWERSAEMALSASGPACEREGSGTPRRVKQDVRIGRTRSSSDFMASVGSGSRSRGRSCGGFSADVNGGGVDAPRLRASTGANVDSPPVAPRKMKRCDSVPPTGTVKADDAAAAQAKVRAIQMLKQFFAEEMAKGGQDANAAAAAALRRLTEAPGRTLPG